MTVNLTVVEHVGTLAYRLIACINAYAPSVPCVFATSLW